MPFTHEMMERKGGDKHEEDQDPQDPRDHGRPDRPAAPPDHRGSDVRQGNPAVAQLDAVGDRLESSFNTANAMLSGKIDTINARIIGLETSLTTRLDRVRLRRAGR